MELGLIASLVKQGLKPAAAAEHAAKMLKVMKDKKPKGYLMVLPGGLYTISDDPPSDILRENVSIVVVNVRQLEHEISTYLEEKDE